MLHETRPSFTSDADEPNMLTKHHRKPRSLQGGDEPRNISYPPLYRHKAWHALYQDFGAKDTIALLLEDYELLGVDFKRSALAEKLCGNYVNSNSHRIKRRDAWRILFKSTPLDELINEINTIWLDPDYMLAIKIERVFTFTLTKNISRKAVIDR